MKALICPSAVNSSNLRLTRRDRDEMFIAVEWWDGMNNSGGMAGLEKSILDPKR